VEGMMSLITKDDYIQAVNSLSKIIADWAITLIHMDDMCGNSHGLTRIKVLKEMKKAYKSIKNIVRKV